MSAGHEAHYDPSASLRGKEGPVFNEPWEAQAFALAVHLSEAGCFSWPEWSRLLGQEIKSDQAADDSGSDYYQHWLNALEQLCINKGLVTDADLHRRKEEWRQSYLHTPHGQAVELSAGLSPYPPR